MDLLTTISNNVDVTIGAVAALGTAASGLVDATKALKSGGISSAGLAALHDGLQPFAATFKAVFKQDVFATLDANHMNGMAKADQKAAAKALVRLGITPQNAEELAKHTNVDAGRLTEIAAKIERGEQPDEIDLNLLGRFDAHVSAIIDSAYERADQQYRNKAKALSMLFSILLALLGGAVLQPAGELGGFITSGNILVALFVGAVATPLAPIAKDLQSGIGTAMKALAAVRR